MYFSLRHLIQTGSGAHPVPYTVGTEALSPAVKWPGREADHSPPSSASMFHGLVSKYWIQDTRDFEIIPGLQPNIFGLYV